MMPNAYTLDLERLSLRQYLALFKEIFRPADLARMTGIPKPRASEILRGLEIYPAARKAVRKFLGEHVGDELFAALLENSRIKEGRR